MRLAPLLLLLAAAAPGPAPPAAPPALLLLRAACPAPLRHLFDALRLQQYEPVRELFTAHRPRILSYEETCGPAWSQTVTRASLAALSEGSAVLSAGWLGAEACAALVAGARALRQAPPAGARCAGGGARGAAVVSLARSLRWRRALVPAGGAPVPAGGAPVPARGECAAALRDVARALAAADVSVHRAALSPHELAWQPHVVILCASHRVTQTHSSGASLGEEGAGPPLLLVHVEDPNRVPFPASTTHPTRMPGVLKEDINGGFQLSNISLAVNRSLDSHSTHNASFLEYRGSNLSLSFRQRSTRSITKYIYDLKRLMHTTNRTVGTDTVRVQSQRESSGDSRRPRDRYFSVVNYFRFKNKGQSRNTDRIRRDLSQILHSDFQIDYYDAVLVEPEISFFKCVLLLTDEDLHGQWKKEDVYRKVVDAFESDSFIERTHFHLYQKCDSTKGTWRRAAVLATTSSESPDTAGEWQHRVEWSNASLEVEGWGGAAAHEAGGAALWAGALGAVGGAALLAGGAALAARGARRGRRRADVLLRAADFSFPAEDARRVGDGVESMLSCVLRQLHDLAPDLPPAPAPPPHPAPPTSSTCSVNRAAPERRVRYKGEAVHVRELPGAGAGAMQLKRKAVDVLLLMQNLRHENLNPFIGWLSTARGALVFAASSRGSLEDVLVAEHIELDWTFRLSLLTDLVRAMRYLHASPLRVHGRLSSRNCLVDSRWVLRLTDYGLPALRHAQGLPPAPRSARELLWTAPELLRESRGEGRGSQPGDVFSFAIIMQEVIVRGEPYCMLSLTPDEIVEKLCRGPPLVRPSVSLGAAPPEAVRLMRQCWSEAPDARPDFARLQLAFRHLHRGRKINIVDSMFEMLEKYSNNLEELVRERTEQLDMEKKKTEQLLNRMLPRPVAERLLAGARVPPEEFGEVSVYFSDIVGFTALAARSTPVQVVDLLNDLYSAFDAAIEQYAVYKVETIGDAYMVVGGLPARARDHAAQVATMALHLLHVAGRFRIRHLPAAPLHLRSGLHSGPCCAAVVGLTMPRYCLFGDTVNTASRMESTGAAWRVQVSATTAELLRAAGGYRLRSRGLTQIKGKGAMHTYWLLGKDGFDKPLPTPPPLESEEVLFETDGENESDTFSATTLTPLRDSTTTGGQSGDISTTPDRQATWQRSGALSADSSPPPRAPRPAPAAGGLEQSAPYSRYRCLGNGRKALRRQWSLERGDTLAAAAAGPAPPSPPSPPEPLALRGAAPRAPPRYRTRRGPDAPWEGAP